MKKYIRILFATWQQPVAAAVLGLLFAVALVFLEPIYYYSNLDTIAYSQGDLLLALAKTIGIALPLALVILVLFIHGGTFFRWLNKFSPIKRLPFSWTKRSVLAVAGIILFFWLPWIIIYFPGSTPYDPVAQIYQIHGSGAFRPELWTPTQEGWISNSHPILHTLILGGFFELGNALGSQNLGIFMYSIFQSLVRALTFAAVCCYLKRLGVPKIFCLLTLVFFALFPAIASSSMVTFKDHLFSPIYVIYVLQIIEITRTKGAVLKNKRFVVALIATSLLMPLLKHPGLYIVVACSIGLIIIYRKHFKQLLPALLVPVATVCFFFPLVLFPLLQIVPAGSQDMFGPLFAQTARVIDKNPDAMNTEERGIIDKVVPYRIIATGYSTSSTDYIKGNFRQDSSFSQRLDYLALWARQGFVYPLEYFEGFFTIQDAWLYPAHGWEVYDNLYPGTAQHVVDVVGHNNRLPVNKAQEVREQLYFDSPVELYSAKLFLHNILVSLRTIPGIGFLFTNACYTFFLPFFFAAAVLLFKRRYLPIFLPVVFSFAVLLISPMDMSRYALPMLEATPLIFGVALLALMYPQTKDEPSGCGKMTSEMDCQEA